MTTLTEKKISKQLALVERLVPKLFKRIGYSFTLVTKQYLVQSGETLNFNELAREALWIATSEFKHEAKILERAGSLIIEWLDEDTQYKLKERLRLRVKRFPRPTRDPFSLPWGARVSAAIINSGEKGPIDFAIEPTETDEAAIEKDSAQYLFKIFGYILEWWGPQALVWFVLYMSNGNFIKTMKVLDGTETDLKFIKQAIRTIPRIKLDIQSKFQTTRF